MSEKHYAGEIDASHAHVKDTFTQNSRVYFIAIVAYLGIVLFGALSAFMTVSEQF